MCSCSPDRRPRTLCRRSARVLNGGTAVLEGITDFRPDPPSGANRGISRPITVFHRTVTAAAGSRHAGFGRNLVVTKSSQPGRVFHIFHGCSFKNRREDASAIVIHRPTSSRNSVRRVENYKTCGEARRQGAEQSTSAHNCHSVLHGRINRALRAQMRKRADIPRTHRPYYCYQPIALIIVQQPADGAPVPERELGSQPGRAPSDSGKVRP